MADQAEKLSDRADKIAERADNISIKPVPRKDVADAARVKSIPGVVMEDE
ncbi:hypothetical protein JW711_00175 [Candidatus Woesearchaeota archaeon]|nr:hypothetical protein [Candidatus Woesearchaeota archaeon]